MQDINVLAGHTSEELAAFLVKLRKKRQKQHWMKAATRTGAARGSELFTRPNGLVRALGTGGYNQHTPHKLLEHHGELLDSITQKGAPLKHD